MTISSLHPIALVARRELLDASIVRQREDVCDVLASELRLRWLRGHLCELAGLVDNTPAEVELERIRSQVDAELELLSPRDRGPRLSESAPLLGEAIARFRSRSAAQLALDATNVLLSDLDLSALPLAGAALQQATLLNVQLASAILSHAVAAGVKIATSNLDDVEVSFGKFDRAYVNDSSLQRMTARSTRWRDARLFACQLRSSRFNESALDGITFEGCDLRDACFTLAPDAAIAEAMTFRNCDLRGADWRGRDLSNAVFETCQMAALKNVGPSIYSARISNAMFTDEVVQSGSLAASSILGSDEGPS